VHRKIWFEITTSEYAQKYNVTDRTARIDLNELVEKELLIKKGETNQSKYLYIINKVKFPKFFRMTSEVSEEFPKLRRKENKGNGEECTAGNWRNCCATPFSQ